MSTRLTTRATTRRRARRRERRERYHHARIVPSSRVARAHRRDDTSSSSPRDDCARARELNEFPPPSTPRRRARVATTRDTRRTKYSSRHERARARITDRIAPYLDRWRGPPTISVTAVPRVLARGPRRTTARGGSRPIGDRSATERRTSKKKPARSPRLARARLAPGTLARASSRTVEPSIRARAMDAPPSGLDGESRPVVCLV